LKDKNELIKSIEQLQLEVLEQVKVEEESYIINELNNMVETLTEAKSQLEVEKYKIVFIGEKGNGKTTLASHLFDLISYSKPSSKERKLLGDEVKKVNELLTTGSGGTTMSEVVIVPDSETFIEIKKMENSKVISLLEILCHSYWSEVKEDKGNSSTLPEEYNRGLRNLIRLTEDEIIKLASDCKTVGDFIEEIVTRANLNHRTTEKIVYCGEGTLEGQKDWLRREFGLINRVAREDMSIPEVINVHVNSAVLNDKAILKVESIIDTRGLDSKGWEAREDLHNYLNKQKNTICVFVGGFNNPITYNTKGLIDNVIVNPPHSNKSNLVLLVNWEEGQPENTIGDNGVVEDEEEGINHKRNAIWRELHNLDFDKENILFYNPFGCFVKGKVISNSSVEVYNQEKIPFIDTIFSVIRKREEGLIKYIYKVNADFRRLTNGRITKSDMQYIEVIKRNVESLKLNNNFIKVEEFNELLTQCIASWHPSTINATNKLFGEWYNGNVYQSGYTVMGQFVDSIFEKEILKVVHLISSQKQYNISRSCRTLLSLWEENIIKLYNEFKDSLGEKTKNYLGQHILSPKVNSSPFWSSVISRYGKGKGYVKDVTHIYKKELDTKSGLIYRLFVACWEEEFLLKIDTLINYKKINI